MSKYIEALEFVKNELEDNYRGHKLPEGTPSYESVKSLQEAISKAEKYDELCRHNVFEDAEMGEDLIEAILNQNRRLIERKKELKARNQKLETECEGYKNVIEGLKKSLDMKVKEINTLVDGIKAMVGVTVFYDRGVVSVSGLGYGEDSDIRYDSIVKSFEIVEGKK